MADQFVFHTLDDLRMLSDAELNALWELVPTERQKAYRSVYDREVRDAGASGTDALELQVTRELLRRYDGDALVPIGSRWARTPIRVREAATDNTVLASPDDLPATTRKTPPLPMLIGVGGAALLLVGMLVFRMIAGGDTPVIVDENPTVTTSPTPENSPTPTPLALEEQDDIIRGGRVRVEL